MKKNEVSIKTDTILYVFMEKNIAEIHASGDMVYKARMTLSELEDQLGDGFIRIHPDASYLPWRYMRLPTKFI